MRGVQHQRLLGDRAALHQRPARHQCSARCHSLQCRHWRALIPRNLCSRAPRRHRQTGCGRAFPIGSMWATLECSDASRPDAPPARCGTRAQGSGPPRARRPAAGRRPQRARAATARPRPPPRPEAPRPATQRCGCRGPAPPPRLPPQRRRGLSSRLHASDRRSRPWDRHRCRAGRSSGPWLSAAEIQAPATDALQAETPRMSRTPAAAA